MLPLAIGALLLGAGLGQAATAPANNDQVLNHARLCEPAVKPAFLPLPPGAVEPAGWLRAWAQAARAQALPAKPVTGTASETVRLVPYGCTKFRVSMFPVTDQAWAAPAKTPADYVDPKIGTAQGTTRWMLFPGATTPFGMVALSPHNLDRSGWYKGGFDPNLNSIAGFSHIHGWTMSGLSVMPATGPLKVAPGPQEGSGPGYRSRFSHDEASPGYYALTLDDYRIRAEFTASTRCGFHRYTFPKTNQAHILFSLKFPSEYGFDLVRAHLKKVSDTEIIGYARQVERYYTGPWQDYTLHFVIRFSRPFASLSLWNGTQLLTNATETASGLDTPTGAFANFVTEDGEAISVQTAFSMVSIPQARLNLDQETKAFGWDFEGARKAARKTWSDILGRVAIEGGTETDKTKFYTCLYRSYCARMTLSDVNGKYRDMGEEVVQLKDPASAVYGGDAFWNTFWNLNQLWCLLTPDVANRWVNSLLECYDRGGWLPKGPAGMEYSGIMEAEHEMALIVGAYQKGIRKFDAAKAYRAMRKMQTEPGRQHGCGGYVGNVNLQSYRELGYVPYEEGPVSNTLEYGYDDWCVAQMALALGHRQDYRHFLQRSLSYKNVFDPTMGYVRPKSRDGRWRPGFDPFSEGPSGDNIDDDGTSNSYRDFVEGNSWQYTFFVPHDLQGLIRLMGREQFNQRLLRGFENSRTFKYSSLREVAHGNQPNMQAAYLFNYSQMPWETQRWSREIMDVYYGATPEDGYQGDEDEGQMSAWFAMSALGLFEMDGGTSPKPIYEIGSPLFERMVIQLDPQYYSGKTFVIEARNNSKENRFIQSAQLNGKPWNQPWFYHSELVRGGSLVLQMGSAPNTNWGSSPTAVPPSWIPRDITK